MASVISVPVPIPFPIPIQMPRFQCRGLQTASLKIHKKVADKVNSFTEKKSFLKRQFFVYAENEENNYESGIESFDMDVSTKCEVRQYIFEP